MFERDGKPVRDREQRLAAIFLKGGRDAFEQARAVMDEGARYNIGNINRNINTPTLPLAFLTERHRRRFEFKLGKRDESDPASRSSSARRRAPPSSRPRAAATCLFEDVSGSTTPTAPSFAPSWMRSIPASKPTSP